MSYKFGETDSQRMLGDAPTAITIQVAKHTTPLLRYIASTELVQQVQCERERGRARKRLGNVKDVQQRIATIITQHSNQQSHA